MHPFWSTVILPALEVAAPERVVQVGVDRLTPRLAGWCLETGTACHVVTTRADDVAPEGATRHVGDGVRILEELPPTDVLLVGHDPNWWTVLHLMRAAVGRARRGRAAPPLILVHNVDWPYGRRDMYREPDAVPARYRHELARAGVTPGHAGLTADGVNATFLHATHEGGPHNGVRTAVEELLATVALDWRRWDVPGFQGLAVVAAPARIARHPELEPLLEGCGDGAHLAEQLRRLDAERLRALDGIERARGEMRLAQDEADELAGRLTAARDERRSLPSAAEVERLVADADAARADVGRAQAQAQERERALRSAADTARDAAAVELRAAQEARDRLRDSAMTLYEELATLQEQHAELLERTTAHDDDAQRELRKAAARLADADRREEDVTRDLQNRRKEVARLTADLDRLEEQRAKALGHVERVGGSRAWRLGHALTSAGRRLTLRRSHGTDGLSKARELLAPPSPDVTEDRDDASPAVARLVVETAAGDAPARSVARSPD